MRLWPFFLGLPSLISYVPGTGPQALFGDASLSICQKTSCEPASIQVIEENKLSLKKSQISLHSLLRLK